MAQFTLEKIDWFLNAFQNQCYQQTAGSVREILADRRYAEAGRLLRKGQKVFSQADEDGIISEIFRRVGVQSKICVEIGSEDGAENNTRALLYQGWTGFWIESKSENTARAFDKMAEFIQSEKLKICTAFVKAENINDILSDGGVPSEFDLLSIDIDGNDYYIFEALPKFKPRVVVIEYNAKFPADLDRVQKYDPDYVWNFNEESGASLKALERLFAERGYALVGCNISGANAFFVRRDVINGHFCEPFTAENHYQPRRHWLVDWYYSGAPELKYEKDPNG